MRKLTFAALAASAMISTAAVAAVDVDSTGVGFVGKGDVQLAFGWTNKQLQDNAAAVTFTYEVEESYHFDCTFTQLVGRDRTPTPQTTTRGGSASVSSDVAFTARTGKQITGFTLKGFPDPIFDGDAPAEGGYCSGGPLDDGVISNVVLNSSTGGLFVNFGGDSVSMPNTPAL